jgi:hypothetical protein
MAEESRIPKGMNGIILDKDSLGRFAYRGT